MRYPDLLPIAALCAALSVTVAWAHEFPCDDGMDNDLDGPIDCMDTDCSLDPGCLESNCRNDLDDNGNGLVDCLDPACWSESHCIPENCTNGRDDDSDTLIDCDDEECEDDPVCTAEICDNGFDDDGDGMIDCDDLECCGGSSCPPISAELCLGFFDEDCDGFVDCADTDCVGQPGCLDEDCFNGSDDDADGDIDCEDADCVVDPLEDCDGDGVENAVDCAPAEAESWAPPLFGSPHAIDVVKAAPDGYSVLILWEDLSTISGPGTRYDILRGDLLTGLWTNRALGGETCLATGAEPAEWDDFVAPGFEPDFYYLVRARNGCPAPDGVADWGHDVVPLTDCP